MARIVKDQTKKFLKEPLFIQSGFSIVFDRQLDIRRKSSEFEDILSGNYQQPQIINVLDEFQPEVPRITFNSKHSYSQIIISQISITLNVNYSPDWQGNINLGRVYLTGRVPLLFDLVGSIKRQGKVIRPHFCGLLTLVRIPSELDDTGILEFLAKYLSVTIKARETHDLQRKITSIRANKYFSNLTIENYRTWQIEDLSAGITKLPRSAAIERGVQISGDFNDRYAYQEKKVLFFKYRGSK